MINKEGLSPSGLISTCISWKESVSVKVNSFGKTSPIFG